MSKEFLDKVGFVLEGESDEGVKKYFFNPNQNIEIKDYYTININ
jgi:hypothetical protein